MKTFKWSIPEPRLSKAEMRDHLDYQKNRKENKRSDLISEHPLFNAISPFFIALYALILYFTGTNSEEKLVVLILVAIMCLICIRYFKTYLKMRSEQDGAGQPDNHPEKP